MNDQPQLQNQDTTEPKKSHMKLLIIVSIITVLLVAAGTVAAITAFGPKSTPASTAVSPTPAAKKTDSPVALTASALVNKVKTGLTGTLVSAADNLSYQDLINAKTEFFAPTYKVPGYQFATRPSTSYGLDISDSSKALKDTDLATLRKSLSSNNLVEAVQTDGSTSNTTYAGYYTSDTISCTLASTDPLSGSADSKYSISLACANNADYTANAAALKPYYDAYAKQASAEYLKDVAMSTLKVTASQTAGYSFATVGIFSSSYFSVGGFAGLFYTTPDKVLHYFMGTQNELACKDYSTTELKKAYLGESCYDSVAQKDSTVSL